MDEGESVANFIADICSLNQRLIYIDLEQKGAIVIAKILSSMPSKYYHVRTAWYDVPRNEQNLERLTDHLVNEELLFNSRTADTNDNNTSKSTFIISTQKNDEIDNRSRKYNQNRKRNGSCNYCHKKGHWARECFKKAADQRNKQNSNNRMHSLKVE